MKYTMSIAAVLSFALYAVSAPARQLAQDNVKLAKAAVTQLLKDPASARYGPVRETTAADGTKGICGFVNAKDAKGAYAGSQPFVYNVSKQIARVLDSEGVVDMRPALAVVMFGASLSEYEKYCGR